MLQHVGNPFSNPTILAFCPGICGLERGLIRAIGRIRVLAYVEIEAVLIENLVCAMEQGILAPTPIWSNLKTFNAKPFRGLVDGIIGGYPCQPFSLAGQRSGTDDPRHLYPFISGSIKTTRPLFCFFENVAGHLTLGYPEVSADLRSMGYAVEAGIYSAEEVGASHQRDRLFILAIRTDYLEYAHHYGHDGTQKREGDFERENRDETGTRPIIEPKRPGNPGEPEAMDHSMRDGQQPGDEIPAGRNGTIATDQAMADTQECRERILSECESGQERSEPRHSTDTNRRSKEMGNTASPGQQEPGQGGFGQGGFGQLQKEAGIGIYNRLEQSGNTERESAQHLAHTDSRRREQDREQTELRPISIEQPPSNSGLSATGENSERRLDRWPARPGEPQYPWEEPRVESRMGFTINGYNFREDILRSAGNAVVEQTAEIAFIDLLNKHQRNNLQSR